MELINDIKRSTREALTFTGRYGRRIFILNILILALLNTLVTILAFYLAQGGNVASYFLMFGFIGLYMVVTCAITVKRCHDLNIGTLWGILIFLVGTLPRAITYQYSELPFLIMVVVLGLLKGTNGPNQYDEPTQDN